MKVLIHADKMKAIEKSGVGRATIHQKEALKLVGVDYTTDPKDDYDIAHINTIFPESYALSKKAKKMGKKVILHAHSTEEDFRNSFLLSNQVAPAFKVWLKKIYSQGDLILTPTPYSKRLLENYGLEKPIIAISNGIDLKKFKRDEKKGQLFRKKYGFKKDDKIVISVGLWIQRKGILDFVKLASEMPEYEFFWCGYTNLNTVDSKVRQAIKTKLPNLHFPGYIKRDDMIGAYSAANLFLFATYEETEGIVLLEALAMKTPILVRDIPIYEKWLEDGKNVYKFKTYNEMKSKTKDILEGNLPSLVDEGYLVAKQRDIYQIGLQLKQIYEDLLEDKIKL